jgi:choline dehydrogenase-like flavoprotein
VQAADVCIVGGGAAGITIARAMLDGPLRIVLVEGGELRMSAAAQALHAAACTGHAYPGLDDSRVRALGGTTHVWGGWTRALDPFDFEQHDWVLQSGWPFPQAELDSHFEGARAMLGVPVPAPATPRPEESSGAGTQGAAEARVQEFEFAIAPTRFADEHLAVLRSARNLDVLLGANALGIAMHPNATTARGVHVATEAGYRFFVPARLVILAAGGLENARLLLASEGQGSSGVGNAHDLVGRYFADHLHVSVGSVIPDSPEAAVRHLLRKGPAASLRSGFALTAAARREGRLLGAAVTLHNEDDPHDLLSPGPAAGGYQSLMTVARALRRGRMPERLGYHVTAVCRDADQAVRLAYRKINRPLPRRLTIGLRAEQAPNPDSRVVLDDVRDRFGVRRARLHWRPMPTDFDSIEAARRILSDGIGVGRVDLWPAQGPDGWLSRVRPGAHHMGTTRMHRDPRHGVVDEHCRVHGTGNLYVAGSSVFPTGGWAPPTLTLVALAIRLADRLRSIR